MVEVWCVMVHLYLYGPVCYGTHVPVWPGVAGDVSGRVGQPGPMGRKSLRERGEDTPVWWAGLRYAMVRYGTVRYER